MEVDSVMKVEGEVRKKDVNDVEKDIYLLDDDVYSDDDV
jgi:hypothetical protein